MKNYRGSDYAANKYARGIVYRFANETLEITLENYLQENPGKTESDFAEWKKLSDALFYAEDRRNAALGKKTVSIHSLGESVQDSTASPESVVIDAPERAANIVRQLELVRHALTALTDVQRRRYIQHKVCGLSTRKIAALECTNHKSVYESLQAAEKKIEKFSESA